jgi:hypothetical protein
MITQRGWSLYRGYSDRVSAPRKDGPDLIPSLPEATGNIRVSGKSPGDVWLRRQAWDNCPGHPLWERRGGFGKRLGEAFRTHAERNTVEHAVALRFTKIFRRWPLSI